MIYMVSNDSNLTKQVLGTPQISSFPNSLVSAYITNEEYLKNLSITNEKPIPINLQMTCLDSGNTTMQIIVPLEPQNTYKNLDYSFIKECFSPNFGLNIYSKNPNSILADGDIASNDTLNNSFYLTIESNVSKYFIYLIAKNVAQEAHYLLIDNMMFDKNSIGRASSWKNKVLLNQENNKNSFVIDFECFETGSFLTDVYIDVKGYKRYSFVLNKKCEVDNFSWVNPLIHSRYLVWMLLGSILAVLLLLVLFENLECSSTKQDDDPSVEPNEAALSLLYDIKFSKGKN